MRSELLALAAFEVLVNAAWLLSTTSFGTEHSAEARASIATAAHDLLSAHAKSMGTSSATVSASAPPAAAHNSLLSAARVAPSRTAEVCISRTSLDGTATAADATRVQSAKDVERDVFIINGRRIVGATAGYAAVEGEVARVLASVLPCAAVTSTAAAVSSDILKAANRTESGGDGFEAAQRALGLHYTAVGGSGGRHGSDDVEHDDVLQHLLVADSRAAPPISINIFAGPIEGVGKDKNAAACAADARAVWDFLSSELSTTEPAAHFSFATEPAAHFSFASLSGAFHWADGLRIGARVELRASTMYTLVTATTDEPQRVGNVTAEWERDVGWVPSRADGLVSLFDIHDGKVTVTLELTQNEREE